VKAKHRIDWQIPDPKHMPPEEFRKVRDYIKSQISGLLQTV
jgi:protein-tyrosine-phosphatase